ncbi:MAG TPA: bifunctional pyr operon transcriptional regulator/uracil phosphoribosyltransferase PyrR [Candidatus Competibacteraceae bacterium]|nr:bifunctional pyr operon transcriptional regulator/uracil phosphoribosyltransferase PyrR [Candidatus Competibacteraceae bacterium]MCP5132869.1 bifunctional pyr operon transcriptional regulator/uracil phosphoribosyltransferase PyrR [Gammaproteobacteria bacterium]HPF58297.1 bifunctional pyr operon transcriptional regulator/uracil phosphoribosyltransferase PyrR [Candidatus Competibacteraceae bacterium]HRY18012.1 bifunctional pyr operon transcriptional regulator/uracil phosphoribosyltransferase Py
MRDAKSLIETMASQLRELLARQKMTEPALIGIHTGGVWVAEQLHAQLGVTTPLGRLDISFYRDDFSRIGVNPQVRPSELPFDVENRHLILIDDVLYTGRTVRAALNELFDYGRPASVLLAVLVDRGGRELPIEANVAGTHLTLSPDQHVRLTGPDPLQLLVQTLP